MSRTGFSPETKAIILDRAIYRCERCGEHTSDCVAHHRRPRGAGGSKRPDTNLPSNAAWLCAMCHNIVESHRQQAYDDGFLVHQGHDPRHVPIKRRGEWCYLADDGSILPAEDAAGCVG